MKKINACAAALVMTGLLLPTSLYAQYVGPSNQIQPKSVAEILKNPVDDQVVVLQGYITKKIGKKKYIFSDGTAEIRVEIDAKHMPTQQIDQKTHVQLTGEVETEFMESPEIEVELITILK
jgi:uncharacterized protein (TIGR00156 family)